MKQNKKWSMRIASFCLAGACLCGGAVLAAGGDESRPLVTLSYLTQTVTPNILKQVDEQAAKRQSELLAQLNTAIADYKMAVEGGGASGGTSASYSVVTLTSGQTLALGVGCEVMLRVGTATLAANTDPGLIDVSTGGTLNNGGALTANHLYMATIADRTVQATAATVKRWCGESTPSPETGAQTEGPACLFDMPGPF